MALGIILCGLVVGIVAGLSGMGGVLLPPCMVFILGMDIHLAMGTSMASMVPSVVFALIQYYRRGYVNMQIALPLVVAGTLCVLLGTELKAVCGSATLQYVLGGFILVVGGISFRRQRDMVMREGASLTPSMRGILFLLGGAVGIISGLTGAGGSVLTIPSMIILGFTPLEAISAGFVYAFLVCCIGTVGNAVHGAVDFWYAILCAAGQIMGTWVGMRLGRRLSSRHTQILVATVCVLTGLYVLVRASM